MPRRLLLLALLAGLLTGCGAVDDEYLDRPGAPPAAGRPALASAPGVPPVVAPGAPPVLGGADSGAPAPGTAIAEPVGPPGPRGPVGPPAPTAPECHYCSEPATSTLTVEGRELPVCARHAELAGGDGPAEARQTNEELMFAADPPLPLERRLPLRSAADAVVARGTALTVSANGRRYAVQVVKVRLKTARLKVGLAKRRVGQVESLAEIAKRYGAVAGINASFFDAYTSGPIKVPHHTLICDGRLVHKGNIGTLFGVTEAGRVLMDRVPLRILGELDGSTRHPNNWWAYWINRLPSTPDIVTIFTPDWGPATGLPDGVQVVVADDRVVSVGRGSQAIPREGYVIYLRGSEEQLAPRFQVGRACRYHVLSERGGDLGPWRDVREAVGAGPRLLTDGRVTLDAVAEGFSHEKILRLSATRSMIGTTKDGWLLMATASGTVREMADVMKALGADNALNLDGGASSGLWLRGKYLTSPGRLISNAILVVPR